MSAIHLFSSKSRDIDICFEYVKNVLFSSKQRASSILFIYDFFSFLFLKKRNTSVFYCIKTLDETYCRIRL